MNRCSWVNLNNSLYVKYHDEEWGELKTTDQELFELLILEMHQAGLSWETILKKRENYHKAFDDFDIDKIIKYDEAKINSLMNDKGIIRNKRKIISTINNAKIFKDIVKEYGSFYNYLLTFTKDKIFVGEYKVTNSLSDTISKDLKMKGMSFVGSTIIYSYLQAIGIINDHEKTCFKFKN